jgi:hypothetical protein
VFESDGGCDINAGGDITGAIKPNTATILRSGIAEALSLMRFKQAVDETLRFPIKPP